MIEWFRTEIHEIRTDHMANNEAGTLLTCTHEDCGCRVRIEVACHCPGASGPYRCTCGDDMVVAT